MKKLAKVMNKSLLAKGRSRIKNNSLSGNQKIAYKWKESVQ